LRGLSVMKNCVVRVIAGPRGDFDFAYARGRDKHGFCDVIDILCVCFVILIVDADGCFCKWRAVVNLNVARNTCCDVDVGDNGCVHVKHLYVCAHIRFLCVYTRACVRTCKTLICMCNRC